MKNVLIGIGIIVSIVIVSGCLSQLQVSSSSSAVQDVQKEHISDETCGECHIKAFNLMLSQGGKHDKGCTFCHIQHGYKPKCVDCHELIHGLKLQDCKDCHDEHAPLSLVAHSNFEQYCSDCHPEQIEEFLNLPGRHADLLCIYCHRAHRQFDPCITCHAPHSPDLIFDDCLNCHPAHMPQEIKYFENVDEKNCAACHKAQISELDLSSTKHSSLNCTYCHEVHKQIPECTTCHTPHTQDMTHNDCTGCHPAHDPVVETIPPDTPRNTCAVCHENIDAELRASNTNHDDLGCVYCHPKHGFLPTCESCHDLPHQRDIHESYPKCMQCHIVSHDVKNIVFTR